MKILYIELHKYKRFTLIGEVTVKHTFDKKVILVKGRNGSGKSSFFNELTPLPSDRKDFHEGGYKKIEILHANKHYQLESNFTNKSPKYSFIVDGEELNDAGIVTTQRLLVYQHFGITKSLHEIMIGIEEFTNMSIGARKKLFTSLTKLNIDEVLRNYETLRSELKSSKYLHLNYTRQHQSESSKLINEEELKNLKEEKSKIQDQINLLLETKNKIYPHYNYESSEGSWHDLRRLISERNSLLKNNYHLLTSHAKSSVSDIISEHKESTILIKSRIDNELDRLEELEITLREVESNEDISPDKLEAKREELLNRKGEKLSHLKYLEAYKDSDCIPRSLESSFYNVINNVPEIIESLPPNKCMEGNTIYGRRSYENAMKRKNELLEAIAELTASIIHLEKKSNHEGLKEDGYICPICEKNWRLIDLIDLDKEKASMEDIKKKRLELEEEVRVLTNFEEKCVSYFNTYSRLMNIVKDTREHLGSFWEDIESGDNLILSTPNSLQHHINILIGSMSNLREITSIRSELKEISRLLDVHKSVSKDSSSSLKSRIREIENTCSRLYSELAYHEECLDTAMSAREVHKEMDKLDLYIKNAKEHVWDYNMSYLVSDLTRTLDSHITKLRLTLDDKENLIRAQDNVLYTIQSHQKAIDDVDEDIKVLEAMLTELSPKNGIIAKTISSFLNTIINNINMTLSRIWSYEMSLEPIDLTGSDLNYKFRLNVENRISTDDISLASKGQKEAINLSFKLVMYKLLNFSNYPLYLDELASNMDEVHTENMGRLVHSFATESNFEQIFIISHKENMGYLQDSYIVELS